MNIKTIIIIIKHLLTLNPSLN